MMKNLKRNAKQNITQNTKQSSRRKNSLTDIRHEIQLIQLILIIVTTILMSIGGAVVNVNASDKAFDQNLEDTAELITRIY